MIVIGYILALIIGLTLGLIGSGGSILAVPVLAYLFAMDEKIATAYSLFIVGSGALVGGLRQNQKGHVAWRIAVVFGMPAIIGVSLVRHFVIPILPDILVSIGDFEVTRRMGMFGLFAVLMILAAYSMLTEKGALPNLKATTYNYPLIFLEGLVVGGITGFVGAGGGFLIIPALVLLAGLEIKQAIGTSLIIIALKSLLGFLIGDVMTMEIDWGFLLGFTSLTIVGIFLGVYISNFIDGSKLKKGFGYFILVMAIFILIMEFLLN